MFVCVCMFVSNMFVCMCTHYVRSCPTRALLGLTQCEMNFFYIIMITGVCVCVCLCVYVCVCVCAYVCV